MGRQIIMERIIWILLLIAGLASCSEDRYRRNPTQEGKVELRFAAGIPAAQATGTRSLGEMTDNRRKGLNLWLVVFDEDGFLVETAMAREQTNQADETIFKVELIRSAEKRIIHFVAVDFTDADTDHDGINDSIAWNASMRTLPYGHETEVVRALKVDYPTDAYWQRIEVKSIHDDTRMTRVPLVRNFAQIVIEPRKDSEGNIVLTDFELEGFAVCNTADAGTVAPYHTSNGDFVDYLKNGETPKNYEELHYHGVEASGSQCSVNVPQNNGTADGGLTFDTQPKYLYESTNSLGTSKGRTYVIVKGRYKGNGAIGKSTYYKVDLVKRGTTGMEYYDVLRNIVYKGSINEVVADGYSTAYQASEAAASNNISSSTTTEGVPNISDSKQRIFVSTTFIVMTRREAATVKYRYIPNLANGESYDNGRVKYNDSFAFATLNDDGSDDGEGWRTLTITPSRDVPKGGAVMEDTIHFYVTPDDPDDEMLSRDVRVIYREPYMLDVACPPMVNAQIGEKVPVTLHISKDFSEKMFPLTFKIESSPKTLYPDTEQNRLPVQWGKSLADGTTNSFWYEKTITWDDYLHLNSPEGKNYKELPCHFLTNTAESAARIYAYNEYCNMASTRFVNPVLKGVSLNARYYGKGQPIYIDIDVTDKTIPLTIKIEEEGGTETTIDWQSGQTSYTSATQTFAGKVTVTVTIDGTDYSSTASAERNTIESYSFSTSINSYWDQKVTIYKGRQSIGSGRMGRNGFTSDVTLSEQIDEDTELTFTYRSGYTYTATAKLSDLLNGTTLKFSRK